MTVVDVVPPTLATRGRYLRSISDHLGWQGVAALVIVVALALMALLAPLIAPQNPNLVNLGNAYAAPSGSHWLGTDAEGRDLLSRLIWGARPALLGPFLVVTIATVVGSGLAIGAAWSGGAIDLVVARALDVLFAFPAILLAIFVAAVVGASLTAAVIAVAIAYVPYTARVIRSEAVRQRALPYVAACEAQGQSAWRICVHHLFPNLVPLIVAQMTISFGYAMLDLSAISFLGLGVSPPTADWGVMVAEGEIGILRGYSMEAFSASALIVVAVVAFTVLGDRLGAPKDRRG